jgi:nucleotide-binding universal stress UspA family protein
MQPEEVEDAESIVEETARAAELDNVQAGGAATLVNITTRQHREAAERAIAEEAKKGYGLLLIGVESAVTAEGEIEEKVAQIAAVFEGSLAIAIARERDHREAAASQLDILVPVPGTGHSRRGAEVALALARASLGRVTVLHVARRQRPSWRSGANEAAILHDAVGLGDQFGVPVRTVIRAHPDPEEAIFHQLQSGEHELIVMGVSPRPGATLSFGGAAAAILTRSNQSILFVAS